MQHLTTKRAMGADGERSGRLQRLGLTAWGMLFGTLLWTCSEDPGAEAGRLSMALSTHVNGSEYRLRHAQFLLSGLETRILDGDSSSGIDDGATSNDGAADCSASAAGCEDVLEEVLPAGNYQLELRDGWQLERNAATGFVGVTAALVSANPEAFSITGGQITRLSYVFETEGGSVSFDTGTLQVGIDVIESAPPDPPVFDAAACDFQDTSGCEALTCEVACAPNNLFCRSLCTPLVACVTDAFEAGDCEPSAADPLCAQRNLGTPNVCTQQAETAGGPDTTNPTLPAFLARQLVRCLCSTPRP